MASTFLKHLTRGMLPHIILETCLKGKTYGYEIIKNVRRRYGVYHGPSTVYPILGNLEDSGLIKSEWDLSTDRPRKCYILTLKGRSLLQQMELDIKTVFEVLTCER